MAMAQVKTDKTGQGGTRPAGAGPANKRPSGGPSAVQTKTDPALGK
jgi:hypothetical protein